MKEVDYSIKTPKQAEALEKYSKKYVGMKLNMLTALEVLPVINGKRRVICQCDCGNKTITSVGNFKNGVAKSCGCLRSIAAKANQRAATTARQRDKDKFSMPDDWKETPYGYMRPDGKARIYLAEKATHKPAPLRKDYPVRGLGQHPLEAAF